MTKRVAPYISFVATSRNDNHGGDMTKRMCIFVKGLIHQCNQFKVPAELIMVEWNPPADRPPLKEVLPQVTEDDFLTVRYIVVPTELHQKLRFSERLPLFQMIAKNVGIRRASAPFVLCTNIDLLFSDALFEKLARQDLKTGHYYRANRCDIPSELDENGRVEDWLTFAANNILVRLGKSSFYPNLTDTTSFLFRYRWMIPVFQLASRLKRQISSKAQTILQELDTEACGDFTLMSKEDWLCIEGYPELEVYSLHIDSMGLIAASTKNIQQVVLRYDACTYHLRHSNGWEFANLRDKLLFYTNKPVLDWWSIYEYGREAIVSNGEFSFNGADWGMNDVELVEY